MASLDDLNKYRWIEKLGNLLYKVYIITTLFIIKTGRRSNFSEIAGYYKGNLKSG